MDAKIKRNKKNRRHKRIRAKVFGTAKAPRLCVFRSAKHICAQLINDEKGQTLIEANDLKLKNKKNENKEVLKEKKEKKEEIIRKGKIYLAYQVGKLIAEKALEKKIERVVFDRGGYKYHGRVKSLAEGAREGGLKF